jgi:hypothetical protein
MHIALATNQEYPRLVEGEVLLLAAFSKAGYDCFFQGKTVPLFTRNLYQVRY